MPDGEIRVLERLFARDAFCWVESEKFRQQVESERVGGGIERLEGDAGLVRKGPYVVLSLCGVWQCQPAPRASTDSLNVGTGLTLGDPTRRNVLSLGVPRKCRTMLSWSM